MRECDVCLCVCMCMRECDVCSCVCMCVRECTREPTHVDLIVIHLSCSSFLVSVNLVSPAFAPAIIPALLTRESVRVDFPWST